MKPVPFGKVYTPYYTKINIHQRMDQVGSWYFLLSQSTFYLKNIIYNICVDQF